MEIKAQMVYEKSFMDTHPEIVNPPLEEADSTIPLTFQHQETEHLKNLCKNYRSKWSPLYYVNLWSLRSHEPRVETQYLRIRRLGRVPRPIKIKIIRCTEKYALIEAGDGCTGYILKLDKANLNTNLTIFNIDAKFLYKQESQQQTVPLIERPIGQPDELLGAQSTNNRTDVEMQIR